jgi:hypothetical protein
MRKWMNEHPYMALLNGAKYRAKKQNIEFSLTRKWAEDRWNGHCELTGIKFQTGERGVQGARMYSPSIDRINPNKGYTENNCRFVLYPINGLKFTGSDQQMYKFAEHLIKSRRS